MSRPGLMDKIQFHTMGDVARVLEMSRKAIKNRMAMKLFGPPTKIGPTNVKYFSDYWLSHARIMMMWERKQINTEQRDLAIADLNAREEERRAEMKALGRPDDYTLPDILKEDPENA